MLSVNSKSSQSWWKQSRTIRTFLDILEHNFPKVPSLSPSANSPKNHNIHFRMFHYVYFSWNIITAMLNRPKTQWSVLWTGNSTITSIGLLRGRGSGASKRTKETMTKVSIWLPSNVMKHLINTDLDIAKIIWNLLVEQKKFQQNDVNRNKMSFEPFVWCLQGVENERGEPGVRTNRQVTVIFLSNHLYMSV